MRIRRTAGTMVLAGLMMIAAGCGDEGGSGGGGGLGGGLGGGDEGGGFGGGKTTITFDIEGEETLKGEATEAYLNTNNGKSPESCAEYAKGSTKDSGKTYFVLPLQLEGEVGGRKVGIQVLVSDYTGPGLYPEDKLTAEGVSYGIRIDQRPYVAQGDGSGSAVTVDADGGGTFTFEKLAYSTGGPISPGISGQVSWTCAD